MCEGLRGIENVIVSAEETNVEHEEGMIWGADITTWGLTRERLVPRHCCWMNPGINAHVR